MGTVCFIEGAKSTTDQSHLYRKARERSIFQCPFQINTTHSLGVWKPLWVDEAKLGRNKHPASSPLDEQMHKKQRDESDSDTDSSQMNVSSPIDVLVNTPVSSGGSLGTAILTNEQSAPKTPNSDTSTSTVMPNLEWRVTSPGTASTDNPETRKGDGERTEA